MNDLEDTIAAISTPFGESGIGIVRLSGKNAIDIADKIFQPHGKKKLKDLPSHTVRLGYVIDGSEIVDEVLVCVMYAPKTYTREDIVEISGHGGPIVLNRILKLCLKNGARLAKPGEFTKRAFLNGRIDLTQAEAVCDLIRSKTELQSSLFVRNICGEFKNIISQLKNKLIETISLLELNLDFPEEDIELIDKRRIEGLTNEILSEINELIKIAEKNKILREGVKVSIIGKPNVGKSSLLNALLKEERVIVTPFPGTTRDIVSETFNLNGIPITVMDTAGIREHTYDKIEKIASERAERAISQADVILFVCDASERISEEDFYIMDLLNKKTQPHQKVIIVFNKIDLGVIEQKEVVREKINRNNLRFIEISAKMNIGIENLEKAIIEPYNGGRVFASQDAQEDALVVNLRCKEILERSQQALIDTLNTIENEYSQELVALQLRRATNILSEITGEITTEDILDYIFSNFCIGK